jgi:hypothetical protein
MVEFEDWTNHLAGARMAVDQQFEDRVLASDFSNQQWGLIMSAVEFRIERAAEPEVASLVVETEQVEAIVPELNKIQSQMGGAPGADQQGGSDSAMDRLKGWLGMDQQNEADQLAEATDLVEAYGEHLERYLKDQDRWEDICAKAAADQDA